MKTLRFGTIGCGGIASLFQLPALRRCERVDLLAVADVDADHARTVARRFHVNDAFTSYRDMIGDVDAVLIATPNTTHADIACDLLDRGIHVLCEKPLATTPFDVTRMHESAERGGARLMSAQCLRFSPNIAMLKRVVAEHYLGDIKCITGRLGSPYAAGTHRTDFRRQRALSGGGVLMDLGVHLIDLALWINGTSVRDVAYEGSAEPGWNVESDAELALEFADGARGALVCSLMHALDNSLTVEGTHGWARASLYDPTMLAVYSTRARVCRRSGLQEILCPGPSMYDAQIAHFCDAVLAGEEFLVRGAEIHAGLSIVEECYAGTALAQAS